MKYSHIYDPGSDRTLCTRSVDADGHHTNGPGCGGVVLAGDDGWWVCQRCGFSEQAEREATRAAIRRTINHLHQLRPPKADTRRGRRG